MEIDKIIKNVILVDSAGKINCDLLIANGKIAGVVKNNSDYNAKEIINGEGLYALPGCVDEHVHMMDPGHTDREEFETGTAAAAVGGVTTVMEHHRSEPPVYSLKELREKINYLNNRSYVDFCLKGGIKPDNLDNLEEMWNEGISGFKTFTCDLHGVPAMSSGDLYKAFLKVKSFDGIVLIHCEDDSLTKITESILKDRRDYLVHEENRSRTAEKNAVEMVLNIARDTKVRINIAHVSQGTLLKEIHEAKSDGVNVNAESCPHYFWLTEEDLMKKGPWVKFTPPMRDKENRELMWKLLNEGYVDLIGSDHCPYPIEQKKVGEKNIWDAPDGIPGVETSLRLMLNGVSQNKTTLEIIVKVMAENPAKIYGLYPKKGTLKVGSDADIVLVDMQKKQTIKNEDIISKCRWTPYNGMEIQGVPVMTLLRGRIIAKEGKLTNLEKTGNFLKMR